MSEFKFACPVCGQHMMCDESQGGSVMDCPTCYQKIVTPQAPGPDAKFILTGTKLSEKKINVRGLDSSAASPAEKKFPAAVLIVLVIVCAAGVMMFAFRGKIFKSSGAGTPTNAVATTNAAPPAADTNWTLTLDSNTLPDSPAAGRIHAQNFICQRAIFRDGWLTLRAGTRGPMEFGVQINFGGVQPEALSGKSLNIIADTNAAARVTLRWQDEAGTVRKENYGNSYAMRLEFGTLANNWLPGKIYLCTPDKEKSYVMGAFTAIVRRPKSPEK